MTGENRLEFWQKDMIPLHRHYLIVFLVTVGHRAKNFIFKNPLRNGCNNMCRMLIFVKIKNNYFSD